MISKHKLFLSQFALVRVQTLNGLHRSARDFYVKLRAFSKKSEIFHNKFSQPISFLSQFHSQFYVKMLASVTNLEFTNFKTKSHFYNVAFLQNSFSNSSEFVLNPCVTCKQIAISPKETHNPQNTKHSKMKFPKLCSRITNSVTSNIFKDRYWWKTTYSP